MPIFLPKIPVTDIVFSPHHVCAASAATEGFSYLAAIPERR
jgi:hypothetical protein